MMDLLQAWRDTRKRQKWKDGAKVVGLEFAIKKKKRQDRCAKPDEAGTAEAPAGYSNSQLQGCRPKAESKRVHQWVSCLPPHS